MGSFEHDTGGSAAGTQLRRFGPTPLAFAVEQAEDVRTDPDGSLAARLSFVRTSLRLLVAVMDAERRALELPTPPALGQLIAGLRKPSMGLWSQAAAGLARELVQRDDLVFPSIPATLYDGRRQTAAAAAFRKLTEARNEWAHADETPGKRGSAGSMLTRISGDLRCVFDAMRVWSRVPLVHLSVETSGYCGRPEVAGLVFRGTRPQKVGWTQSGAPPPIGHALAIGGSGDALVLTPWVLVDRFDRDLPEARVLVSWSPGAPLYAMPGRDNGVPSRTIDVQDPGVFLGLYAKRRRIPGAIPLVALREICGSNPPDQLPRLPGYRVQHLLGRGASGQVWLAEDEHNGERWAVKTLRPELVAEPRQRKRLAQEAALLRRMPRHPGIARLHHHVEDSEEGPFLVMEYVRGQTLQARLNGGPLDEEAATRIALRLLETLDVIHGSGVIHRDIKPSNIMLTGADEPRLVDFGIGRADGLTRLTRTTDGGVGTLAFSAPEQRESSDVDHRADLYAVGRVLQEMLFPGRSHHDGLSALPGSLRAVVRRATRTAPAHRYESARSFHRDLETSRAAGFGGAPVQPGGTLGGGLRIIEPVGSPAAGVWAFRAEDAFGSGRGVLVCGTESADQQRFRTRMGRRELHRPWGISVRKMTDGVMYAEFMPPPGDVPLAAAAAQLWQGCLPDGHSEAGTGPVTPAGVVDLDEETAGVGADAARSEGAVAGRVTITARATAPGDPVRPVAGPADPLLLLRHGRPIEIADASDTHRLHMLCLLLYGLYATRQPGAVSGERWARAATVRFGGLFGLLAERAPRPNTVAADMQTAFASSDAWRDAELAVTLPPTIATFPAARDAVAARVRALVPRFEQHLGTAIQANLGFLRTSGGRLEVRGPLHDEVWWPMTAGESPRPIGPPPTATVQMPPTHPPAPDPTQWPVPRELRKIAGQVHRGGLLIWAFANATGENPLTSEQWKRAGEVPIGPAISALTGGVVQWSGAVGRVVNGLVRRERVLEGLRLIQAAARGQPLTPEQIEAAREAAKDFTRPATGVIKTAPRSRVFPYARKNMFGDWEVWVQRSQGMYFLKVWS